MEFVYGLLEFIQANGWFLLIGGFGIYYLFNKYNLQMPAINMRPSLSSYKASEWQ